MFYSTSTTYELQVWSRTLTGTFAACRCAGRRTTQSGSCCGTGGCVAKYSCLVQIVVQCTRPDQNGVKLYQTCRAFSRSTPCLLSKPSLVCISTESLRTVYAPFDSTRSLSYAR